MIYELAALEHPFKAPDMQSLYNKVVRGDFLPIPHNYSRSLRNLIKSMLTVNPRYRVSCDRILSEYSDATVTSSSENSLLSTIYLPKHWRNMSGLLPTAKYVYARATPLRKRNGSVDPPLKGKFLGISPRAKPALRPYNSRGKKRTQGTLWHPGSRH